VKILIYGINYAPELTGIGKYTAEAAEALAALGHEVRVVCAPPYYPQWRVDPPFSGRRYTDERRRGVRLFRAPLWVPVRPGGVARIAHLASFAVTSLPLMLGHALWRPRVVICIAPSLLNAPAGWFVARLSGARAWLHIQDYEVDAAFKLGVLKRSWLMRAALAVERAVLKRFDSVSSISNKMLERAASKGVDKHRLVLFTNWVDTDAIHPLDAGGSLRATLRISGTACIVLYSGNMGAKQGLEVLADAALQLADKPDIVFVFCGNGPARKGIEAACGTSPNCRFLDLVSAEKLNELLNLADIHVLPQRADAADLVMPSKLTGMFASGRPVIAMAPPDTELHDVVTPRGVVVPPGDARALAEAIDALSHDTAQRERLGSLGRSFALSALSRHSVLHDFERRLRELSVASHSAA
jgi:colanic acid biosynthesis glycosyl transferase WcaI